MRTWTGFVRFVVQPSAGLLWAHEHSNGGSFRQMQGLCRLVEGLPARQVAVVHGIILSKCEL